LLDTFSFFPGIRELFPGPPSGFSPPPLGIRGFPPRIRSVCVSLTGIFTVPHFTTFSPFQGVEVLFFFPGFGNGNPHEVFPCYRLLFSEPPPHPAPAEYRHGFRTAFVWPIFKGFTLLTTPGNHQRSSSVLCTNDLPLLMVFPPAQPSSGSAIVPILALYRSFRQPLHPFWVPGPLLTDLFLVT